MIVGWEMLWDVLSLVHGKDHLWKSSSIFIYSVLKILQWSIVFPGTLFQCLTIRKSSLVDKSSTLELLAMPFVHDSLCIGDLLKCLFMGMSNTGSSVFQQKSCFKNPKLICLLSSLPCSAWMQMRLYHCWNVIQFKCQVSIRVLHSNRLFLIPTSLPVNNWLEIIWVVNTQMRIKSK